MPLCSGDDSGVVTEQREHLLAALAPFATRGQAYALVDFPDHSNVGDSAIWLGEAVLLKELTGRLPAYVCTHTDYKREALAQELPEGVIFFHGGGNIGDLWPANQRFRERILRDFPDRTVVMLPSSIHFSDQRAVGRFNEALADSASPRLFVRDQASLDMARSRLECPVSLLPDTAMGLGPLVQPARPKVPLFALLRTDIEGSGADYAGLATRRVLIEDWLEEPPLPRRALKLRAVASAVASGRIRAQAAKALYYRKIAAMRVRRGLTQLCQGEVVITDRLHAHILCTMMGKPHVVLDNSYGKVSGYFRTWHSRVPSARFVEHVEAIDAAAGEVRSVARAA